MSDTSHSVAMGSLRRGYKSVLTKCVNSLPAELPLLFYVSVLRHQRLWRSLADGGKFDSTSELWRVGSGGWGSACYVVAVCDVYSAHLILCKTEYWKRKAGWGAVCESCIFQGRDMRVKARKLYYNTTLQGYPEIILYRPVSVSVSLCWLNQCSSLNTDFLFQVIML